MKINEERLLNTIIKIGEIGKINHLGISRIAFSKEYFVALKELKILMEKRNLKVRIDNVGGARHDMSALPCCCRFPGAPEYSDWR